MSIETADVVRSIQGRDKEGLFYVLRVEGEYAYLVNGRDRRIEKAKKKKLKHIQRLEPQESRVADKLRSGDRVTNSDIRKALQARPESKQQGGTRIGEGRRN